MYTDGKSEVNLKNQIRDNEINKENIINDISFISASDEKETPNRLLDSSLNAQDESKI